MFLEYAREVEVTRLQAMLASLSLPPLVWRRGRIPNIAAPAAKVRIRDRAVTAHYGVGELTGEMMTWGWEGAGRPVFTMESEKSDFADSERILAPATGFYEHKPGTESKDSEHYFATLKDEEWFWIPAVVRNGCFALLTTLASPDMESICKRHVCMLSAGAGLDWLTLSQPAAKLLQPLAAGRLHVEILHGPDRDR
jgi:putative SOS response-associated peptidase YedK